MASDADGAMRRAEFERMVAPMPDFLLTSLTALYDTPPKSVVEVSGCSETARALLFFPEDADGDTYARIFRDESLRAASRPALALMYALHGGRVGLKRRMVLAGGLEGLARRFTDADLHVRAHAVEVFGSVTQDDDLWYASPESPDCDAAKAHELMLKLSAADADAANDVPASAFFRGLAANRSDSYPGGEAQCLKLVGFWLGWARQLHSEHKRVSLGRRLVEALSDWAGLASQRGDAEEAQLASRLFDDFSRNDAHDGVDGDVGGLLFKVGDAANVGESDDAGAFDLSPAAAAPAAPERPAPASALAAREAPPPSARDLGNVAFARGDFDAALAAYAIAAENSDGAALALLRCNRATCFLKLHDALDDESRTAEMLDACEAECAAALLADARNAKAHYRRAQSLAKRRGSTVAALQSCEAAAAILKSAPRSQRAAVDDLLVDLLRKLALEPKSAGLGRKTQRTASVVARLLGRPSAQHEMLGSVRPAAAAPPPPPPPPDTGHDSDDDDAIRSAVDRTTLKPAARRSAVEGAKKLQSQKAKDRQIAKILARSLAV